MWLFAHSFTCLEMECSSPECVGWYKLLVTSNKWSCPETGQEKSCIRKLSQGFSEGCDPRDETFSCLFVGLWVERGL